MIEGKGVRIVIIKQLLRRLRAGLKGIIDREIPEVRGEFYAAKELQDKLRKKLPNLTDDEWLFWDKLVKDVPRLRDEYHRLQNERDGYIEKVNRLEKELEELEKEPEFIDIDESTGYLIYYSRIKNVYFKVRPDEYKDKNGGIEE